MSAHPSNSGRDNPGGAASAGSPRGGAPATLGEFEIRGEIGRGGMGTVYEAFQRSLHRVVALKILDRQVAASRAAVTRFQREAQAAARLQHPHIVAIYAQGEEHGVHYYAMEFVDGESLNAVINRSRDRVTGDTVSFDPDETAVMTRSSGSDRLAETVALGDSRAGKADHDTSISLASVSAARTPKSTQSEHTGDAHIRNVAEQMLTVADALHYAHESGIVHRDIKPHNLLMGRDGRLRISDFGLARLAQQPGVTMTGEMIGSPLYMSPEQILGGATDLDRRTDIYSLGASLYEWLTLSAPYPADTREQVIGMILQTEPQRPRNRNPSIPPDLETICLKAIDKDRGRRYQTAAELRDDLRRFLDRRPIHARRMGGVARSLRWMVRHPATSIGVAAAIVAVVLGWSLYAKQRVLRSQDEAIVAAKAQAAQIEADAKTREAATNEALKSLGLLNYALYPGMAVEAAAGAVQKAPQGLNSLGLTGSGLSEMAAIGSPSSIARRVVVQYYKATLPEDGFTPTFSGDAGRAESFREALRVWSTRGAADAIGLVNIYLNLRPNDFDARRLRLALCAELRRFDEMLVDAESLVKLQSQSPDGYLWRGAANLLMDRIEKSIGDLNWVTQIDENSAWGRVLYGLALIRDQRAAGAKVQFEDAMRLSPEMATAALGMASAHVALNEGAAAQTMIRRLLAMQPEDPDALALSGDANMGMAAYEAAGKDFQKALRIVGSSPSLSLKYLAATMQQQAEKSRAAEATSADATSNEPRREEASPSKDAASVIDWFSRLIQPPPKTEGSGKGSPGTSLPTIPKPRSQGG